MMMHKVYAASDGIMAWFRDNAVILTFIAGQALVGIIWGADLTARLRTVETRGSPALDVLAKRVDKNDFWIQNHERVGAAFQNANRIISLEREMAVVREHDASMLDILRQNSATMKAIADGLTKHMLETDGHNERKKQ